MASAAAERLAHRQHFPSEPGGSSFGPPAAVPSSSSASASQPLTPQQAQELLEAMEAWVAADTGQEKAAAREAAAGRGARLWGRLWGRGVGAQELAYRRWAAQQSASFDAFFWFAELFVMALVATNRGLAYSAGCEKQGHVAAAATTPSPAPPPPPGAALLGGGSMAAAAAGLAALQGEGEGVCPDCGPGSGLAAAVVGAFPCDQGGGAQFVYTLRHLPGALLHGAVRRDDSVTGYVAALAAALAVALLLPRRHVAWRQGLVLAVRLAMMVGNLTAALASPPACLAATTALYYLPSFAAAAGSAVNTGMLFMALKGVTWGRVPFYLHLPFSLLEWGMALGTALLGTRRTLGPAAAAPLLAPSWLLAHGLAYWALPAWALAVLERGQRRRFRHIAEQAVRLNRLARESPVLPVPSPPVSPFAAAAAVGRPFGSRSGRRPPAAQQAPATPLSPLPPPSPSVRSVTPREASASTTPNPTTTPSATTPSVTPPASAISTATSAATSTAASAASAASAFSVPSAPSAAGSVELPTPGSNVPQISASPPATRLPSLAVGLADVSSVSSELEAAAAAAIAVAAAAAAATRDLLEAGAERDQAAETAITLVPAPVPVSWEASPLPTTTVLLLPPSAGTAPGADPAKEDGAPVVLVPQAPHTPAPQLLPMHQPLSSGPPSPAASAPPPATATADALPAASPFAVSALSAASSSSLPLPRQPSAVLRGTLVARPRGVVTPTSSSSGIRMGAATPSPTLSYRSLTTTRVVSYKARTHPGVPFPVAAAQVSGAFQAAAAAAAAVAAGGGAVTARPIAAGGGGAGAVALLTTTPAELAATTADSMTTALAPPPLLSALADSTPPPPLPPPYMSVARHVVVAGCVHLLGVVTTLTVGGWDEHGAKGGGGAAAAAAAGRSSRLPLALHAEVGCLGDLDSLPQLLSEGLKANHSNNAGSSWNHAGLQGQSAFAEPSALPWEDPMADGAWISPVAVATEDVEGGGGGGGGLVEVTVGLSRQLLHARGLLPGPGPGGAAAEGAAPAAAVRVVAAGPCGGMVLDELVELPWGAGREEGEEESCVEVRVRLPAPRQPGTLYLHLLPPPPAIAPAPCTLQPSAGAPSRPLASLPLLCLPSAASAAELCGLYGTMLCELRRAWLLEGPEGRLEGGDAGAAAFQHHFLPFAQDLGHLLACLSHTTATSSSANPSEASATGAPSTASSPAVAALAASVLGFAEECGLAETAAAVEALAGHRLNLWPHRRTSQRSAAPGLAPAGPDGDPWALQGSSGAQGERDRRQQGQRTEGDPVQPGAGAAAQGCGPTAAAVGAGGRQPSQGLELRVRPWAEVRRSLEGASGAARPAVDRDRDADGEVEEINLWGRGGSAGSSGGSGGSGSGGPGPLPSPHAGASGGRTRRGRSAANKVPSTGSGAGAGPSAGFRKQPSRSRDSGDDGSGAVSSGSGSDSGAVGSGSGGGAPHAVTLAALLVNTRIPPLGWPEGLLLAAAAVWYGSAVGLEVLALAAVAAAAAWALVLAVCFVRARRTGSAPASRGSGGAGGRRDDHKDKAV
ncbi:hypothetical protein HYH03_005432 [Edaphochlamys debaryana]|uniref:Uncharacterized protein n=1 Tax=Edaphochlamys debaryana TaxID=47281 RepID=A0A835Y9C5_9CHLO|nr:hypothetical protein HYH03_005432 [Edaphochlamys debaryana]|eukprot:KAG2496611.1 hypothetical protein HYH03_005432 [Edaphochlamys debaryana]